MTAENRPTPAPSGAARTLVFQAPPPGPEGEVVEEHQAPPTHDGTAGRSPRGGSAGAEAGPGGLRMLKGARQAATGMRISDDEIRAVLSDPQDVQPDPKKPQRTVLSRDRLVVTTGHDGTIVRVARRR